MTTIITLNLLAEEQVAQEKRARDPFKMVIAVAVGLVAIVVAVGGIGNMLAAQRKSACATLQEQYDRLNSPQLVAQEAAFATLNKTAKELLTVNHSRYLFAPRLALVKDLTPANVQLNRLTFTVATETIQPAVEAPADPIKGDSQPVATARPKVVERLTMRLDGKAISKRPELDVDVFMRALRADPVLSAEVDEIQLRSIARGPTETQPGAATLPAACFVIECLFKERK